MDQLLHDAVDRFDTAQGRTLDNVIDWYEQVTER